MQIIYLSVEFFTTSVNYCAFECQIRQPFFLSPQVDANRPRWDGRRLNFDDI